MKKKYLYFFRGTLDSHVHFYINWVDAVREHGYNMSLITFINPSTYFKQYNLVRKYKSSYFKIYIDLKFSVLSFFYFFFIFFKYDCTIIHLKKRKINRFLFFKKIFPNKIKIIVEGEGDPILEIDFLKKHFYKKHFYNQIVSDLIKSSSIQKDVFEKADYLTFGYLSMKKMLIKRYPKLKLEKKIILANMSFKRGTLFYSKTLRNQYRKKYNLVNKSVFIYIGNAFYSWQCVFRTIEIFQLLKSYYHLDSFLILLVRPQDHNIILDFIKTKDLDAENFLLTHTSHENINYYLNAADFGFSLRHNHQVNFTTPSAKIIEYLGSGLPVITTNSLGEVSELIKKNKFGLVLDDMDNDAEIINKFSSIISFSDEDRDRISKWTNMKLSTEAKIGEYIELLSKI